MFNNGPVLVVGSIPKLLMELDLHRVLYCPVMWLRFFLLFFVGIPPIDTRNTYNVMILAPQRRKSSLEPTKKGHRPTRRPVLPLAEGHRGSGR